jgi:RNA polymerase sigma-70 factor (ECF subfamily)
MHTILPRRRRTGVICVTEDLEAQARAGDPKAFGALIRRHDDQLRAVAWAVVRDRHRTDDIMQSAYEKAFRSIAGFDGRSSFSTWMHSIVYRTAIDSTRYEGRRRHDDIDAIAAPAARGDAERQALSRVEIEAAMEQLSPEDRAALMLIAGHGLSYDEAAAILGEARGTVASRVSRARKRLAREEES